MGILKINYLKIDAWKRLTRTLNDKWKKTTNTTETSINTATVIYTAISIRHNNTARA